MAQEKPFYFYFYPNQFPSPKWMWDIVIDSVWIKYNFNPLDYELYEMALTPPSKTLGVDFVNSTSYIQACKVDFGPHWIFSQILARHKVPCVCAMWMMLIRFPLTWSRGSSGGRTYKQQFGGLSFQLLGIYLICNLHRHKQIIPWWSCRTPCSLAVKST